MDEGRRSWSRSYTAAPLPCRLWRLCFLLSLWRAGSAGISISQPFLLWLAVSLKLYCSGCRFPLGTGPPCSKWIGSRSFWTQRLLAAAPAGLWSSCRWIRFASFGCQADKSLPGLARSRVLSQFCWTFKGLGLTFFCLKNQVQSEEFWRGGILVATLGRYWSFISLCMVFLRKKELCLAGLRPRFLALY